MPLILSLDSDHSRFACECPNGQVIRVPASAEGAQAMLRILLDQKASEVRTALCAKEPPGIDGETLASWISTHGLGTASAPTQHEIDHRLRHSQAPGDGRPILHSCPFCREGRASPKRELTLEDIL